MASGAPQSLFSTHTEKVNETSTTPSPKKSDDKKVNETSPIKSDEEAVTVPSEIENKNKRTISLVGSDVVALYPSIKAENTARIVEKMIRKSEIKFEGFDTKKARAYLRINENDIEDIKNIEHLLPSRISKNGITPTMASITSKWNPETQWKFPDKELSDEETRLIVGAVVAIALKVLFRNFTYKFGGKFYHQQSGGPIGVRATGAASTLVMEDWADMYKDILERAKVEVLMMAGYVDDGRQITTELEKGMEFNIETKAFEYSEEAEKIDDEMEKKGESKNQRMARLCVKAMNAINPDLEFTTETQDDFPHSRLPTLDFEMWLDDDNRVKHSYFQKSMKTPMVIMERSGISYHQKFQILINELSRRLSNIQVEEIEQTEVTEKVEQFITELKNSGYSQSQAREIVTNGILCWKNKLRKRKRLNIPMYRLAETTISQRLQKQLLEKETWYKNDDKNIDEDEEAPPSKIRKISTVPAEEKPLSLSTRRMKSRRGYKKGDQNNKIKSVIFIPHTRNSELAAELRITENKLEEVTGNKIKIVEKGGRKLENLLTDKDPWKGADCQRKSCFLCTTKVLTGKDLRKDCTKRNILYEIRCLSCEEKMIEKINDEITDEEMKTEKLRNMKTPVYIGESSRSAYERGYEHLDKLATLSSSSHMLRHMVMEHQNMDMSEVKWGMFVTAFKRTAFERQISEAVKIRQAASSKIVLNSRSEWNQSALPSLVTRIGNKEDELKMIEKELRDEKKLEDEIEARIRTLRKEKNKARITSDRPVAKKRMKIDSTTYVSIRETWGPPPPTAPKKKQLVQEKEDGNEKKRLRKDTERLTNIKRIEDKIIEGESITDFEIVTVDWEERLKEHRRILEEEAEKKINLLKKQEEKKKSWMLYRECKDFLECNEKNWKQRREERVQEEKRQERLAEGKEKQERIRLKVKERKLGEKIQEKLDMLPKNERIRIETEENRQRKIDLVNTKKSLWKLRTKEKQYKTRNEKLEMIDKIENMEEKLNMIEKLLEDIKEKRKQREIEQRKRKEENDKEWKKKVREKDRKEQERKELIEKKNLLHQHWEMLRWVTKYIDENSEKWEREKVERENEVNKQLNDWDRKRRKEKIKILQEKWLKRSEKQDILPSQSIPNPPRPPPSPKQPPSAVPPTNKKVPQEQAGMYSENNESKLDKKWRVWQVPDKIKPKPENKQIEIDNIQKEEFTEHREIQYNIKNIMKKPRLELKDNQTNQDNIMKTSENIKNKEVAQISQLEEKKKIIQNKKVQKTSTSNVLRPPTPLDNPKTRKKREKKEPAIPPGTKKITSMFSSVVKTTSEKSADIKNEDNIPDHRDVIERNRILLMSDSDNPEQVGDNNTQADLPPDKNTFSFKQLSERNLEPNNPI